MTAAISEVEKPSNVYQMKDIHEPYEKMITMCQNLLDDAKRGEVQGMIGVVIFDNGNADQFWVDPPKHYHTSVMCDRMVGACERMKFKLLEIRGDV